MARKPSTPGAVIAAAIVMFLYGSLLLSCQTCMTGLDLLPDQEHRNRFLEAHLDSDAPGHTVIAIAVHFLGFCAASPSSCPASASCV
jgi:hypothetical protein